MSEQSDIPAPTPADDVIPYQERIEFVIDQKLEAAGLKAHSTSKGKHIVVGPDGQFMLNDPGTGPNNMTLSMTLNGVYGGGYYDLGLASYQPLQMTIAPFTAGAHANFDAFEVIDGVYEYKAGTLVCVLTKKADDTGAPGSFGQTAIVATRDEEGVITLPANPAGMTLSKRTDGPKDYGVAVEVAAAGWYAGAIAWTAA